MGTVCSGNQPSWGAFWFHVVFVRPGNRMNVIYSSGIPKIPLESESLQADKEMTTVFNIITLCTIKEPDLGGPLQNSGFWTWQGHWTHGITVATADCTRPTGDHASQTSNTDGEGTHKALGLAEEQLVAGGHWGRENQFSSGIWPVVRWWTYTHTPRYIQEPLIRLKSTFFKKGKEGRQRKSEGGRKKKLRERQGSRKRFGSGYDQNRLYTCMKFSKNIL